MIKSILFIFGIFFAALPLISQPESSADSLWNIWQNETKSDSIRLRALDDLSWQNYLYSQPDSVLYLANLGYKFALSKGLEKEASAALNTLGVAQKVQGNYSEALEYYQRALAIRQEIGDRSGVANTLNKIGNVYSRVGDFPKALDHYQQNLTINEEIGNQVGISNATNNIGLLYYAQDDYPTALEYLEKSLAMDQKIGKKYGIASSLNNLGIITSDMGDYATAQDYYQRSFQLFSEIHNQTEMAKAAMNIGTNYQDLNDIEKAFQYFQKSLKISQETGDKNGIAGAFNNIGIIYRNRGDYQIAIEQCKKGLKLAEETGSFSKQKTACECLYSSYKSIGNNSKALIYFEQLTTLKDSIFNEANTEELTRLEMQYDFDKKEAAAQAEQEKKDALAAEELRRQKLVRNSFMGGFAVVLLFAGVFFTQRNRIGKEKQRSEDLLLNILPEEVADELKEKGHSDAQLIEQVTVLFTDFKGFTAMSEILSPQDLVKDLHQCFSEFDQICEKYGIEKIKTIGDAYMAAGGLPAPNSTHAKDVALAALEMAEVVKAGKQKKMNQGLPFFEVRIGIHTGPVVAGIVGVKKFQYDIWGDTVNTASRMESSGEVGKVNVSQDTYAILKNDPHFSFESRGKIAAKGKGEIEMWFVNRL